MAAKPRTWELQGLTRDAAERCAYQATPSRFREGNRERRYMMVPMCGYRCVGPSAAPAPLGGMSAGSRSLDLWPVGEPEREH